MKPITHQHPHFAQVIAHHYQLITSINCEKSYSTPSPFMLPLPSSYKQIMYLLSHDVSNNHSNYKPTTISRPLGLFSNQIQYETRSLDLLQSLKWVEVHTQDFHISLTMDFHIIPNFHQTNYCQMYQIVYYVK